jgi:hypothetical protein
MDVEIINRIANSKLVSIDLEDFYPTGERISFDIKKWLFDESILIEKEFRTRVKNHDWSQYKNAFVALHCSADAIIPSWAYLLISVNLSPYTNRIVVGDFKTIETVLFNEIISNLDIELYRNKHVLIKGCSDKPIPESAYVQLAQRLVHVATSVMYGEACSSVPLYKNIK